MPCEQRNFDRTADAVLTKFSAAHAPDRSYSPTARSRWNSIRSDEDRYPLEIVNESLVGREQLLDRFFEVVRAQSNMVRILLVG